MDGTSYYDGPVTRRLVTWMLLLAAIAVSIIATPSRADEPVDVSIESLTPQLLDRSQPDQLITITGTVRNNTSQTVENSSVHFWRSTRPITEHAELEQVLTSGAAHPQGNRVTNSKENYQDLGELSPGASMKFTVSATIRELALSSRTDAVYLLGALVRSNSSTQGPRNVGRGRAFAVATKKPLQVSTVVKLTTRPTLLDNTDFQDNSLESRLVGELSELLTAAEKPGTYTLLDPSLLVEAQVLAGEHTVAGQAAPPSETADDFVKRLTSLIGTGRVMRLPFGNPDLARLHAAGDLSGLEAALGWSETALKASGLGTTLADVPLVADLGGNDSQDLALTLALHDFQKVFGNTFPSSGEISTTNHEVKAHALRVSSMDLPGIGPGNTFTRAQISGRRLAEELLGEKTTIHMVREAADISRAELLAGSETAAPLPEPSGQARYGVPAEQITSWPKLRSQIQGIFDSTQLLEELTGSDRTALNATIAARAFNSAFQSEQEAMDFVSATPSEKLTPSAIRLSAASQFVMGSETNNFPVTISNPLPITVKVRVQFVSDSPNRIRVAPSELVTLGPGEHRTVSISPSTTANGVVTVRAQLTTEQGTVFGSVVPVEITATGLGRVGWIIIVISGAVVVGGTFLRIRAVQRERTRESREQ